MKMLTCWAEKAVAGWVVAELIFTEQARSDRGTALRTRHVRVDPDFLAGLDVLDLEVAPVGHDRDPLHAKNLLGCSTISLCLASTAICTLYPTATCVCAAIARLSGSVSEIWLSPV